MDVAENKKFSNLTIIETAASNFTKPVSIRGRATLDSEFGVRQLQLGTVMPCLTMKYHLLYLFYRRCVFRDVDATDARPICYL